MDFDLHPWNGAGSLVFGMRKHQIRKIIDLPFRSFRRAQKTGVPDDYFWTAGLFAYYDHHGRLEALEFATPAAPTLDGINLLALPFDQAKQLLRTKGGPITEGYDDAQSDSLGIGLWAPKSTEHPTASCDSVILFRRGYYDQG